MVHIELDRSYSPPDEISNMATGSYTQYCDLSRQYDPKPSPNTTTGTPSGKPVPPYKGESIDNWFAPYGKFDLLAYMKKFWVSQGDLNWVFWAHEFSKHATCYSTFQTECFVSWQVYFTIFVTFSLIKFFFFSLFKLQGPKAAEHDDMFEFFETVIDYYKDLPTWRWLADAGITPSNATSYTLSHIQDALTRGYGKTPYLGCGGPRFNETAAGKGSKDNGRVQLQEVWYYQHVKGRVQDKNIVKLNADVTGGSVTSCAKAENAIWYYKRAKGSEEGNSSCKK